MHNTFHRLLAAALVASAISFIAPAPLPALRAHRESASIIKGRVDPTDGAVSALAISATDSARAVISDGMFELNVGHGTYKLVVVARPPYKTVIKDNVEVAEGNTTDVGTIKLQE
jgi:hypothetical protein